MQLSEKIKNAVMGVLHQHDKVTVPEEGTDEHDDLSGQLQSVVSDTLAAHRQELDNSEPGTGIPKDTPAPGGIVDA